MRGSVWMVLGSWPDMAAFCWKLAINIAACSIPNGFSLSPNCSNVASSSSGILDGPLFGEPLFPVFLLLVSLWSGTPPSLAWTVRSCLSNKSLRTKVLRHFIHLNGRSLVSAFVNRWSAVCPASPLCDRRVCSSSKLLPRDGLFETTTYVISHVATCALIC